MKTLGLIAGGGELPMSVARDARSQGVSRIVGVGFPGQTAPELAELVDEMNWIGVGQLGKLIRIFKKGGVSEAVMIGRIDPKLVISKVALDVRMLALAMRIKDRRPDTVLRAIADEMNKDGIRLIDSTAYLRPVLAGQGPMTGRRPDKEVEEDIKFGTAMAREIARLDIGQTVAVRKKAVVAVEAMEGTDAAIRRAGELCAGGMVVAKVSRPRQDMRFDVAVVGRETIELLALYKAAALALEAGKVIIIDKADFLKRADSSGIAVVGV